MTAPARADLWTPFGKQPAPVSREPLGILIAAETLLKLDLHHEARAAIREQLCIQDNRKDSKHG